MNRDFLKDKNKIVIKVGSSNIVHTETGDLNYAKLEKLIRIICDLKNQGKDVILVSSGAIAVGKKTLGLHTKPKTTSLKQACAAVGQGQLMMVYQKLFAEYHQNSAQVLLTGDVITNDDRRNNAINTFNELLQLDVVPIVNENDTVATEEIEFGDNDTMSAIVASLVGADLLILLSDIDGLYTNDPNKDADAELIYDVEHITEELWSMAKGSNTSVGTGGMITKLGAASIANASGADMVIINGDDVTHVFSVMNGEKVGTLFHANKLYGFDLLTYLKEQPFIKYF